MTIEVGKKIKQLRAYKGITQDALASYLNISFQAVSKWENGSAMPDITLLPKISTYFGITIDELFTLDQEAHFERIDNMLTHQHNISEQDQNYAKRYLSDLLTTIDSKEDPETLAKSHGLLAQLFNHRAKRDHEVAREHAKQALALDPLKKHYHVELVEAHGGICNDWNYDNKHALIAYYKTHTQNHPQHASGFMYLLNHLILDGRTHEARVALENLKQVRDGYIIPLYEGKIEKACGHHSRASEIWDQMVIENGHDWLAYASRADEYAKDGAFEEAIAHYEKSMALAQKPRYYDGFEAMAHIYEIQGKPAKAIEMWEAIIKLQQEEYNVHFGELIDGPRREMDRIRSQA